VSGSDITKLWHRVTELVFERSDRFGPLIQCMRAAVPIVMEGDTLIVGLSGAHQYLSGHLETPANRRKVLDALQQIAGKPIEYRLIEGTAEEDWKNVKEGGRISLEKAQRAAGVIAAPTSTAAPATAAPASAERGPWQEFYQRLHFAWQAMPLRTLPVPRAQFLQQVLPLLGEAEAEAASQGDSEEAIQRALGRAVERIATIVDLPATAIALELLRVSGVRPRPAPAAKPPPKKRKSK